MALVGKPVTLEEIKKTCYTSIESVNPSSINWDQVIGQGTYGIILGVIQDDDWVIKIANKKNSCTTLKHEYTFHNDAFLANEDIKTTFTMLPIFTPHITNYLEKNTCCAYYMSRIYPVFGNKLLHCLIDSEYDTYEKWSGIFPNNEFLQKILDEYQEKKMINSYIININSIAYLNGIIYGSLHYKSKQSAQDIEIVLGRNSPKGQINVYFFDFDKSQSIVDIEEKELIKILGQSMDNGYSKFLGVNGGFFKEGYLHAAEKYNALDIATKVIKFNEEMEGMLMDE